MIVRQISPRRDLIGTSAELPWPDVLCCPLFYNKHWCSCGVPGVKCSHWRSWNRPPISCRPVFWYPSSPLCLTISVATVPRVEASIDCIILESMYGCSAPDYYEPSNISVLFRLPRFNMACALPLFFFQYSFLPSRTHGSVEYRSLFDGIHSIYCMLSAEISWSECNWLDCIELELEYIGARSAALTGTSGSTCSSRYWWSLLWLERL